MTWIVCGWYTPDYKSWVGPLIETLEAVRAPHDFVEVPKQAGGWEINTMHKATQIQKAMQRHPDKTIVFIDVDCTVLSRIDALANIPGDVGLHVRSRQKSDHTIKLWARSGTMVFKPNQPARDFVQSWIDASSTADRYAVDQDSLIKALCAVPNLSLTMLGEEWCATASDKVTNPKIFHSSASVKTKTPRWRKSLHRWGVPTP